MIVPGAQAFFADAVGGAPVQVKAGEGQIFGLRLVNTTAAAAYLQVFDKLAAEVTLGTTAPAFAIRLGANESLFLSMPRPIDVGGDGLSIAGTTTPTGALAAAISAAVFFD